MYLEILEVEILKPIAIKSFISYSSKNNDKELFNNILNKSLDKKIDFSWIKKDILKFCIEHNNWEDLLTYLEKKISLKKKINKEILSFAYYQQSFKFYLLEENMNAKIYLKKALKLKNHFPPYMELFCRLNVAKNENTLIKKHCVPRMNPTLQLIHQFF